VKKLLLVIFLSMTCSLPVLAGVREMDAKAYHEERLKLKQAHPQPQQPEIQPVSQPPQATAAKVKPVAGKAHPQGKKAEGQLPQQEKRLEPSVGDQSPQSQQRVEPGVEGQLPRTEQPAEPKVESPLSQQQQPVELRLEDQLPQEKRLPEDKPVMGQINTEVPVATEEPVKQ
jgi:hypothetical protein